MRKFVSILVLVCFSIGIFGLRSLSAVETDKEREEVSKLIAQLEDKKNPSKRVDAAKALANCIYAEPAIPALLRVMNDRENEAILVIYVKGALVNIGPAAAKALVQQPVIGPNDDITLQEMGERVVPIIVEELKSTRSGDKFVSLALALGLMEKKAISALPALEELKKQHPEIGTRALLNTTITLIKEGHAGLEREMKELETEGKNLRAEAIKTNKEAEEAIKKLAAPKATLNSEAAASLIRMMDDDFDKALPLITKMGDSKVLEDRVTAKMCLLQFYEKKPALRAKLLPLVRKGLNDDEEILKAISAITIMRMGFPEEAKPFLLAALTVKLDPEKPSQVVVMSLGCIGLAEGGMAVTDKPGVIRLRSIIALDDVALASTAGIVLINSGHHKLVIPVAKKLLINTDVNSRMMGSMLFCRLGPEAKDEIPFVQLVLEAERDEKSRALLQLALKSMRE